MDERQQFETWSAETKLQHINKLFRQYNINQITHAEFLMAMDAALHEYDALPERRDMTESQKFMMWYDTNWQVALGQLVWDPNNVLVSPPTAIYMWDAWQAHVALQSRLEPQGKHCMCPACKNGVIHSSDCAVHNMPAYPNGSCNCGAVQLTPKSDSLVDRFVFYTHDKK